MELRPYTPADCAQMAALFYETVHSVNAKDYSPAQLNAWATGQVDLSAWNASFLEHDTLVCEENGLLLGFADMDASGYLDRLYVHKGYVRRGIASKLVAQLERNARQRGVVCFSTYASLTAQPFFERQGYVTLRRNTAMRYGIELVNFLMEKAPSL